MAAVLVTRFARVATRRKEVRPLVAAALALAFRDGMEVIWASFRPEVMPYVRAGGDTAALLLVLVWTGQFRLSNRTFHAAAAVSAVSWVVIGTDALLGGALSLLGRTVLYLLPPALIVATLVSLVRVDRQVYPRGAHVEPIRPILSLMFAGQLIVYLVVPLRTQVFEAVVAAWPAIPVATAGLHHVVRAMQEERDRTRTLRANAQAIFSFLSGVGRSLGGGRDPEKILTAAIETMTEATNADSGAAVLTESGAGRVVSVVGLFAPPVAIPPILKSKQGALRQFVLNLEITPEMPIWGQTLQQGEAFHIPDAAEHSALAQHADDRVIHLRSVLVLPLSVRGKILGLLSVARRGESGPFTVADFDHARTMAEFVAVTLDNFYSYRVQRDVEIAADIQRRLQATPAGRVGGVRYAGVSRPARGVGGDYYDVIPVDDRRTAVVICDVSGKGVPAALVMVMVRTIAHLALGRTQDAGEVLRMINAGVCGAVELDRFATATVVVFDTDTGSMSYANAAHHPALFLAGDDAPVEPIDADGLPIGIEAGGEYPSRRLRFPAGASLVLFTDGVVEAFNLEGEEFGDARLVEAVREGRQTADGDRSTQVLESVLSRVDGFSAGAPQHDDITMIVCTREVGEQPAATVSAVTS